MRPIPDTPGPGQESVWDFPRPPVIRLIDARVRVLHHGVVVADTTACLQVLETSQAPAYYFPRESVDMRRLSASRNRSWCEWKGEASYWSFAAPDAPEHDADIGWSYESPTRGYEAIAGYLAFFAQRVDECWVDDHRVEPNPGNFYGGWVTPAVVGPFKGGPGSRMW